MVGRRAVHGRVVAVRGRLVPAVRRRRRPARRRRRRSSSGRSSSPWPGTCSTSRSSTPGRRAAATPARLLAWQPRRIDWWAASVQSVGTLLFNISTFAAADARSPSEQQDRLVWAPDMFGSIAFLVASSSPGWRSATAGGRRARDDGLVGRRAQPGGLHRLPDLRARRVRPTRRPGSWSNCRWRTSAPSSGPRPSSPARPAAPRDATRGRSHRRRRAGARVGRRAMLGRCDRRAACRVRRRRVEPPPIETEWQFDAVHLAPVQRWLGQHADGTIRVAPAGTRSLVDTYLDTSDLRIHRAQRSLRLRRGIGRRTEITLKTHAPAVAGVRSREEITERVPVPDVAALGSLTARSVGGSGPSSDVVNSRSSSRSERDARSSCCSTERCLLARWCWIGPWSTSVRGSSRHAYGRVEVEVADPSNPEIGVFVERLRQECGLQWATHTKFEAGFLARGLEAPLARDLGSTSFDLHSSTGELAFAVLRGLFVEMLAHESGTRLGEDPEELHGMRVATRRLRAVLGIFEPALPVRASRFRDGSRMAGSGPRRGSRSRCGDRAASWGSGRRGRR